MHKTKTHNTRLTQFKVKEPGLYNVILHNDDVTTMEFVVYILESIFHKSEVDAEELMMEVHCEGSAVAGTYYKDIAESKKSKAEMLARGNGYPLVLTVEEKK